MITFRINWLFIVSVLDSSARFPFSGLLEGTISDFGEYRQCLRIKVNQGQIQGQYCMTSWRLRLPERPKNLSFFTSVVSVEGTPLKNTFWETMAKNTKLFYIARGIRLGLCVPSTCSPNDLSTLAQGQSFMLNFYDFTRASSFFNRYNICASLGISGSGKMWDRRPRDKMDESAESITPCDHVFDCPFSDLLFLFEAILPLFFSEAKSEPLVAERHPD